MPVEYIHRALKLVYLMPCETEDDDINKDDIIKYLKKALEDMECQ